MSVRVLTVVGTVFLTSQALAGVVSAKASATSSP